MIKQQVICDLCGAEEKKAGDTFRAYGDYWYVASIRPMVDDSEAEDVHLCHVCANDINEKMGRARREKH